MELGELPECELEKPRREAECLGKGSFAFTLYMDLQKEERTRGDIIASTTGGILHTRWRYTVIDALGHCDFIGTRS